MLGGCCKVVFREESLSERLTRPYVLPGVDIVLLLGNAPEGPCESCPVNEAIVEASGTPLAKGITMKLFG